MVELVFNAIHGERFQSCETQIFKNTDGKIKFLLKFPMRNCFKVLSMQPRMTGLLTSWLLACVASVSNRVIAPKLERKRKKKRYMVARIDFDFAKNSDSDQMGL